MFYLNDGRGDACAGHDNDRDNPEGFWYDSDFLVLENLGAVPPTGSMQDRKETISTQNELLKTNLNDGRGEPCAGQVSATDFATFSSNAVSLIFEENLGILLPTGSEN